MTIVLGGDGTMLRALQRSLGKATPVIGVNFGSVGFLTTIPGDELEAGVKRVFAGEYEVVELPTLEAELWGERYVAVNDVVVASSVIGRMAHLAWEIGRRRARRGLVRRRHLLDALGSTGYNLSNGGPVLVWGMDAMTVTFIAPHALDLRPLVVPRSRELAIENRTEGLPMVVLADGRQIGVLGYEERLTVRLGEQHTLLGVLPEATFFRRYRETFAS